MMTKWFAIFIVLFSLESIADERRPTWFEAYSKCWGAVNEFADYVLQTDDLRFWPAQDSADRKVIKRYTGTQQIPGVKDGVKGIYLILDDTSIFVPLDATKKRVEDLFGDSEKLKGKWLSDNYYVTLTEDGYRPVYVTITNRDRTTDISSVDLKLVQEPNETYYEVKASPSFGPELKAQFHSFLKRRITNLNASRNRQRKNIAASRRYDEFGSEYGPPTPDTDYIKALQICEQHFKDFGPEEAPIKEAIQREIAHFKVKAKRTATERTKQ